MERPGELSPVKEFLEAASVLEGLKRAAEQNPDPNASETLNAAADIYFLYHVCPIAERPEVVDYFQRFSDMYHADVIHNQRLAAAGKISEDELHERLSDTATDRRYQRAVLYLLMFVDQTPETPVIIRGKTKAELLEAEELRNEAQLQAEIQSWPTIELDPNGLLALGNKLVQLSPEEGLILTKLGQHPGKFVGNESLIQEKEYPYPWKNRSSVSEHIRLVCDSLAEKLSDLPTAVGLEIINPHSRYRSCRLWGAMLRISEDEAPERHEPVFETVEADLDVPFSPETTEDQETVGVFMFGRKDTMSKGAYSILSVLEKSDEPVFIGALREKIYGSRISSDELEERFVGLIMEAQRKSTDHSGEPAMEIKAPGHWPAFRAGIYVRVRLRLLRDLNLKLIKPASVR